MFEVGLGGRLDATNLVNAVVTVITGISHDHREHLGEPGGVSSPRSSASRARERRSRHSSRPAPSSRRRLNGAPAWGRRFIRSARRHRRSLVALSPERMSVRVRTRRRDYGVLETRMIGRAQMRNVATAIRALELFEEAGHAPRIDAAAVRAGISSAVLAGRFQSVASSPRVIIDVSHNEESYLAALETLRRISPRERTTIVFGALAHKELGAFPARALGAAREIIVTALRDPRTASAERLGSDFGGAHSTLAGTRACVAHRAGRGAGGSRGAAGADALDTILIMGSHVMVEEAARFL